MSIVERALRRVQGGEKSPSRVFGQIVKGRMDDRGAAEDVGARHSERRISINQAALRSAGLLAPVHQQRQIANQYRQIKRPLIACALGRGQAKLENGQLIMVASAMPGEGKTFTAVNLALSMAAESDVRVLLVDGDVAKQQISRMFGVADEPGLLDLVGDQDANPEKFTIPTDIKSLSILPAGRRNELATEILSSEKMKLALRELVANDRSRIIVLDSSPLLLTTESHALSQIVGQIVVVVHSGHTEQGVLIDALGHLPGTAEVALVLNQSVGRRDSSYYYGYDSSDDANVSVA